MTVYDDDGNMANERASEVARNMAKQTKELFEALFATGMTVVEARALSSYIQNQIEYEAVMGILYQQLPDNKEPVDVRVYGKYPSCQDEECPHKRECANHMAANRVEDGDTPALVKTEAGWECGRYLTDLGRGAVFTEGTFGSNWRNND